MADGGLAVEPLPCQLHAQVQSGGAAGEADRITDLRLFGGDVLDLVDILADGAHPVGVIGAADILHLFAVHGGRSEPDLFGKGVKLIVCGECHRATSFK